MFTDDESPSELPSELSDNDPIFDQPEKCKRRNLLLLGEPKAHSQSASLKQTRTVKTKFVNRYHKSKYSIKCQFCLDTVTNYERHLQRNHQQEKEVKNLLTYPTYTPEGKKMRRKILSLLRNDSNFNQYVSDMDITSNRIPCAQCKRIVDKKYLKKHYKRCILKSDKKCKRLNHLAASQTLIAFASQPQNNAVTIRVKNEVFSRMLTDEIGNLARTDSLIRYYGEEYLIKHKRAQLAIACSNKMRESARLLIELRRRLSNPKLSLIEILNPIIFNDIVLSVKEISGYNFDTKTYKAPSLANHLGTTLKQISNCALELLSMENPSVKFDNHEQTVKKIKAFKLLMMSKWNHEVCPFTIKDSDNEFVKSPVALKSELSTEACSSRTREASEISTNADEADVSLIMKKEKCKATQRFKWSSQQKSLVLTNFSNYVINKKLPKKGECLALIEKHKDLLSNLDWVKVKILVYNTWRNKN